MTLQDIITNPFLPVILASLFGLTYFTLKLFSESKAPLLDLYRQTADEMCARIIGRVITYHTENPSSVKFDGVRRFIIKDVERTWMSDDNRKCLTAKCIDLDDGFLEKYRTLHVSGITKIEGRLSSLWHFFRLLFPQKAF